MTDGEASKWSISPTDLASMIEQERILAYRAYHAMQPDRDAQPEAGLNAALGDAFTYNGKPYPHSKAYTSNGCLDEPPKDFSGITQKRALTNELKKTLNKMALKKKLQVLKKELKVELKKELQKTLNHMKLKELLKKELNLLTSGTVAGQTLISTQIGIIGTYSSTKSRTLSLSPTERKQ